MIYTNVNLAGPGDSINNSDRSIVNDYAYFPTLFPIEMLIFFYIMNGLCCVTVWFFWAEWNNKLNYGYGFFCIENLGLLVPKWFLM